MMQPLIVGNWKMHGTQVEAVALARRVRNGMRGLRGVEVVLAPPFTALAGVRQTLRGSRLALAGQDVHWEMEGAFTGEISPKMLRESGCAFVIVGHSERRRLFHESDENIAGKLIASLNAGLRPILCVGETLAERRRGITKRVISRQLRIALKGSAKSAIEKTVVAYEPVWAIGTGQNATADQISEVHFWIRQVVEQLFGKSRARGIRILYGGSVRPDNAEILARAKEVNGLLVGGASLKAADFLSIVRVFVEGERSSP